MPAEDEKEAHSSPNKWYLAYGSNLSSKVFQGRRGVRPLETRRVLVPGLELVFDLAGLPYWEPAFANLRYRKDHEKHSSNAESLLRSSAPSPSPTIKTPELIGVAYLLTQEDYSNVIRTEGGGSSYQDIVVECIVIKDDQEEAGDAKERLMAHTLLAPADARHTARLQPSKRYINIIRSGAREHDLPADYIAYLDSVPHYQRTSIRQSIGGLLFMTIWLVPFLSFVILGQIFADKETGRIQKFIRTTSWWSYEALFNKVFGNGEVTEGSRPEMNDMGSHTASTAHIGLAEL
ncbi:hypothetical protein M422DRAFT_50326 [Sphaerobolus stellatus SS14]|uniref:gamma-glutamylcyclotransferase n=1 Tax=Sphaerobolus stellatus (strain SS14) TaxID=990650 RepID=A0A0C9V7H8_SPHS4|nr:hypothetical protein M422DRAFT_50326 [Sphaerobolus stellatus SS14]